MTTPRTRAIVSLVAALALTLALGACARSASPPRPHAPAPGEEAPLLVRFDNGGREHVHVYLIGEKQEWLLGRVEVGARRALRVPAAARAEGPGLLRLAVIAGARPTLQARHDPRAIVTVEQSASEMLAQRWMLTQGQLASLPIRSLGAAVRR